MRNFEELCRENYGRIYKYIFSMAGSREAAEDLVQDVFAVAYGKGTGFLDHENPTAFLYKTARNLTLTYIKRQRACISQELDESIPADRGDLLDELLRAQDSRIDETAYIEPVLDRLPAKQQALYMTRYRENRPIAEIASQQGISETALRMRLVRLRREISQIVRDLKLDEK